MTNPTSPRTICIYHGNCADGFGAAWAIWKRFADTIDYHPGVYGEAPPNVTGRDVLMVDFSYKRSVLEEMARTAHTITILDHHKTAAADLAPFNVQTDTTRRYSMQEDAGKFRDYCDFHGTLAIRAEFDMERSGAVMAWEWANPNKPVPMLLLHVQDRDLWRFQLRGTREIQACVFSHPYDFFVWDALAQRCETDVGAQTMISEGQAIERKHFKDIDELLRVNTRRMVIGGHQVPVANLPYTMSSDAAGKLAEGEPFGACYSDTSIGRVFSLRSRAGGVDVSEIAKSYGGGGHAAAAGFQMPRGWEGDAMPARAAEASF